MKNAFPNLPKSVTLVGSSILAIDINGNMIYALIKHPEYTLDKCVLAHFDLAELTGKLTEWKSIEIHLKQIHKFDQNVANHIIKVANSATVAVLHGCRFDSAV